MTNQVSPASRPITVAFAIALFVIWGTARAAVVFETTTPHHHIRVVDQGGLRILSFNGSQETRMSLQDPLKGHFEYTEYFHMPWIWNTNLTSVLMIGLGGASTQRAFLHYYPDVKVDTVELDPVVVDVARNHFRLEDTPRHQIFTEDGRQYLRRARKRYDAIILDAYRTTRYGSFLPYHLATKEFFELASGQLTENGVLAYNVMGTYGSWRADILGAMYRTMKAVFPQVYLFPAKDSLNVVLIATKSRHALPVHHAYQRASDLQTSGRVRLPSFRLKAAMCRLDAPPTASRSPLLTDDYAPVDGLLTQAR